jgi:serine/threonine protein phosphatase PrpC
MNYRAFSTTATGSSHIKHGKGCEDFSCHYSGIAAGGAPFALAVVADGHGSEDNFRSARGAEIAAECARQGLIDFVDVLENPDPDENSGGFLARCLTFFKPAAEKKPRKEIFSGKEAETCLRALIKHIVARWQITVEEDYTKNPFTQAELALTDQKHRAEYESEKPGKRLYKAYGTTLIAAAVTADYWFGIHIGDGRFSALYKDGGFDQPVPWDERCFLNVTASICDDDAADRARLYFSFRRDRAMPAAVFLCSDGVDDNYPVDNNEKHLFKLYRTIALTFAEDGFDSTCIQLNGLASRFATQGKGDDTSIAGFIDMDAAKEAAAVWRRQIELV